MIIINDSDNGRTIDVASGDEISVELRENPTTGYCWAILRIDRDHLHLIESEYQRDASAAVGGGGRRCFRLRVQAPGSTRLEFALFRSWEGAERALELRTFIVTSRTT